jgi:hypothetical protein
MEEEVGDQSPILLAAERRKEITSRQTTQSSKGERNVARQFWQQSYAHAITSISTRTSLGSRAASTVERAGGATLKNRP